MHTYAVAASYPYCKHAAAASSTAPLFIHAQLHTLPHCSSPSDVHPRTMHASLVLAPRSSSSAAAHACVLDFQRAGCAPGRASHAHVYAERTQLCRSEIPTAYRCPPRHCPLPTCLSAFLHTSWRALCSGIACVGIIPGCVGNVSLWAQLPGFWGAGQHNAVDFNAVGAPPCTALRRTHASRWPTEPPTGGPVVCRRGVQGRCSVRGCSAISTAQSRCASG